MIPSGRLVALAVVPMLLALAWVALPGLLPIVLGVDGALVALALLDARRSGGAVTVARTHPSVQSVGRPFDVTLTLRAADGRARTVWVDDEGTGAQVEALPARVEVPAEGAVGVTYRRTVPVRGRHVFGVVGVRWASPWGLWWRQVRVVPAEDDAVRVYPDFSHLRQSALSARAAEERMPVKVRRKVGGESEFERLRAYVPGDPYRHVDWKGTARRGRLVSREFGQEANQNVVFLLDAGRVMTTQIGELTAFDHALNAALAMAHTALRHGDRVGLLAFDRKVRAFQPPRGGVRQSAALLQATYDVFPSLEEPDYGAAFRYLHGSVRRRSLVVLLTALQDQVNADAATAVVRALAGRHLPVCVWLRDPAFDAVVREPVHDADGWYRRAAHAELLAWRQEALADWRRRGALVVDCPPERLSTQLLSQYLEIKARRLL